MSADYQNQDPLEIAKKAEQDLNSYTAKAGHDPTLARSKHGHGASTSADESGVDANVEKKFPGAQVTYGSAASGAGDNREIPEQEGGDIKRTGEPTKARDFEGLGGPEDKERAHADAHGGDDDVRENVRQGTETVRP